MAMQNFHDKIRYNAKLLLSSLIFSILMSSCTTIHYRSRGHIPVFYSGKREHRKEFTHSENLEFYFWGLYPKSHVIYLDDVGKTHGMEAISKFEIEEFSTTGDFFKSIFSLGMFIPRRLKISGYGKRGKERWQKTR